MRHKLTLLLLTFIASVLSVAAQVSFSVSYKRVSPTEIDIVFTGKMEKGWHVYGANIGAGGPTAATFGTDNLKGVRLVGKLKEGPGLKHKQDPIFEMPVTYFEGSAQFTQRVELLEKDYSLKGYLKYGACNDENCLPPTSVDCSVKGADGPAKAATADKKKAEEEVGATKAADADPIDGLVDTVSTTGESAELTPALTANEASVATLDSATLRKIYEPSIDALQAFGDGNHLNQSLWVIFGLGFIGGLIALATPCVWPIIPMTVSFFLKRSSDRKKGIRDALLYGIGIIVIYVSLGLIVSAVFGSDALNNLATNAIFNVAFFILLVIFAISFFGAFELVLPASWTAKMDAKADSASGFISIFFMAFTLALVSFSCTGPIIGTLLVQAATSSSGMLAPAVGMLGFALALALPFTLFAIFPNLLQSMPKSGGWMNSVKVVLAFIELALALKFLSIADLAYGWRILDREVFLSLWIVIAILLGLYLLGKIRFPHDAPQEKTPIPALFLAIISFSFAVYMMPGLVGAPLRAISAFAPPLRTQDLNLYNGEVHAKFDDYDAGMAYARQVGKPVMIDFSGYGCVNCRKMEASVWIDPNVKHMLEEDYVLITLMVDEKAPLKEPIEIMENGEKVKLRTVGDKWSYFQRMKFGANAQPFYVLLDHQGKPLAPSYAFNEDVSAYLNFLKSGLSEFDKRK